MDVIGFHMSGEHLLCFEQNPSLKSPNVPLIRTLLLKEGASPAHLNDVEHHVLVETVQDALGHPVVAPGTVNQQELLQVGKLKKERKLNSTCHNTPHSQRSQLTELGTSPSANLLH